MTKYLLQNKITNRSRYFKFKLLNRENAQLEGLVIEFQRKNSICEPTNSFLTTNNKAEYGKKNKQNDEIPITK